MSDKIIKENDTGDMATSPIRIEPDMTFKGKPCFKIDNEAEYLSFSKGKKVFHRWMKHTTNENLIKWARENKGKSFYVTHNNNFTYINRSPLNEKFMVHLVSENEILEGKKETKENPLVFLFKNNKLHAHAFLDTLAHIHDFDKKEILNNKNFWDGEAVKLKNKNGFSVKLSDHSEFLK